MKQDQALFQTKPLSIHSLYDAYSGMLFGYISEIVKDKKITEDYLVKIFSLIATKFDDTDGSTCNTWTKLLRFAKSELTAFHKAAEGCEAIAGGETCSLPNAYLDLMTEEQALIFCSIYYGKKNIAQLGRELSRTEVEIKLLLKEAFAIIRRSYGR